MESQETLTVFVLYKGTSILFIKMKTPFIFLSKE